MRRCRKVYVDLGKRHICSAQEGHIGACKGHPTKEHVVPKKATARTIRVRNQHFKVLIWPHEKQKGIWMAYVGPPYDILTQNTSADGAVEAARSSLELTIDFEETRDVC